MPRSCSTPTERHCTRHDAQWNTAFPLSLEGRLPRLVSLRSCINPRGSATPPTAWPIPCLRFVHAVPPRDASVDGRLFVFKAVPPADFNGLANIYARLGSYYWLGFITPELSSDKKRHALHGAQRNSTAPSSGGALCFTFNG